MEKLETQVIWVGPLATGTYKDLLMQHGNCGGGILRWEGLITNRVVCDDCGKPIYVIDLSKLVLAARTGETIELDEGKMSISPQRYERISSDRLEVALLKHELDELEKYVRKLRTDNRKLGDKIKYLLETIGWAAGELEGTKQQFGSSIIAQVRKELQIISKANRNDC